MSCDGLLGKNAYLGVLGPIGDQADLTVFDATAIGATVTISTVDHAFVEVCAQDVDFNSAKDKIEVSDRCGGGYKKFLPGLAEGTISLKAVKRKGDTWYTLIENAHNNDDIICVLMLDSPNIGGKGIIANCNVFNYSETQPINGAIEINFELSVSGCSVANPPIKPAAVTDQTGAKLAIS